MNPKLPKRKKVTFKLPEMFKAAKLNAPAIKAPSLIKSITKEVKGIKGDRGDQGRDGIGLQGIPGPQGPRGESIVGPIGPQGIQGIDGSPDDGADIIRKINELPENIYSPRIDASHIKNLPGVIKANLPNTIYSPGRGGSGGSGGSGTVTSVSVTTANGVSGSVANSTTTPAITLTLGDITPSSIVASGAVSGSNLSGTNTGNNAVNTLYSGLVTNATHTGDATGATALTVVGINGVLMSGLATGILKNTTTTGAPSIAVAGDFPTLNQSTTGSAATLTTPRAINGVNFDGSAAITVTAAAGTLSGTTLNATVVTSSLTAIGTLASGAVPASLVTAGTFGTGAYVMDTSLTNPLLIGGTAVGSKITYKSTTGAGTVAGIAHQFIGGTDGATVAMTVLNNGNVGVGTISPDLPLEVGGTIASPTPLANAIAAGALKISDGDTVGAVIGTVLTGSSYDTYIQARNMGAASTPYHLILQPLGGAVGIRNLAPVELLSITETVATTTAQISAGQSGGASKSYWGNYNDQLWMSAGGTYKNAWVGDNVNRTIPYMVMTAGNADSYIAFATTATNNTAASERMRIIKGGNIGMGVTAPTAIVHLKAGTATANTAPLKFNTGTLLTTAEAGAVEFLTDAFYGTITTGAARKTFAFLESPSFTTPALGTPASGVLTNCTGLPAASVLAGSFGAGAFVISTSLQAATIELGHATDTTLSRVSAGVIAVEGVTVPTISSTSTITNKRIEPRIVSAASYTTDTGTSLDVSTADLFVVTAQAGALLFNSPGGTPVQGQKLMIRIKDNGTARALTWNAVFRAMGVALPSTTVLSKTLYLGFIYNSTDTKFDLVASAQEA